MTSSISSILCSQSFKDYFITDACTYLAGDGSFKKMYKQFCQFWLNLLIKISYITGFENFLHRFGLANIINSYLKLEIRFVCGGNFQIKC